RVDAGGPAEQAGIQQHDILEKLEDQLLVNPQQLNVLVRSYKSGQTVNLTLLRQGEHKTVPVTLAEKEMPVDDPTGRWDVAADQWALPPARAGLVLTQPPAAGNPDFARKAGNNFYARVADDNLNYDDGKLKLKVNIKNGERQLVAADAKGNVL